jgi:integrase
MVRFPECGRSRAEEGTSFPRLLGVHHAALPYVDVSAFFRESRSQNGIAVQALEFTILTASRTGESMNATWAKIDLSAKVFSIPADRMASSRPHRDPLSNAAIAVLNAARPLAPIKAGSPDPDAPIFASGKRGLPISNMAMLQLFRRLNYNNITVHGFRSTSRDWARECTNFPRDIAEEAPAHVVNDKTETAYRRGDALEKRRRLMKAWAAFCLTKPASASKVASMHRIAARQ